MDPNANLREQRELAQRITTLADRRSAPRGVDFENDAARLAELVQALDDWRQHGGFDPYA